MKTSKFCQPRRGILWIVSLLFLVNLARADVIHFQTTLSGAAESPPNVSPGWGSVDVFFDDAAQTMHVVASFSDLLGVTTAAHIHAATALPNTGTAGVATQTPSFGGFPLGVSAGMYDRTFDLTLASSFSSAYLTNNGGTAATASAALLNAMLAEKTYFNVHSNLYPGGEVRGFLKNVPDTGSTGLLLMMVLPVLAWVARAKRARPA